IGRALEHQSLLERQNATLRAEVSSLSSGDRVETRAAAAGMVIAPPGAIRFLAAGGHGTAIHAARAMTAPAAGGATGTVGGATTTAAATTATATTASTAAGTTAAATPTQTSATSASTPTAAP